MEGTVPADADRGSRAGGSLLALEIGAIALLALAIRLVDLGHPPFIDEMHHVLAAGSLLRDGTLTLADGTSYERGYVFTYLVAAAYALFGQSLEAARLPAVVSGVLLVCLLFAWLRAEAGRIAGWTAALLLCFSPVSLYLSQWVRFYTLHALCFWLGTYGAYRIITRADPAPRRWWIAAGSALAFVLAAHLQITTVVGLAGLGLFVLLVEGTRLLARSEGARTRASIVAGLAIALFAVAGVAVASGLVEWLAGLASRVDVWAIERAGNPRFYHWLLTDQYGFLWALFPFAVLVALAGRWRPALLFAAVFGVGFVAHSVAAWKAERYIFYLMPAFFGVWGLASAEVLPWLWRRISTGGRLLLRGLPSSGRRAFVGLVFGLALAFAASGLTAYTTTRLIYLQGRDWSPPPNHSGETYRGHPDWESAATRLKPLADSVDVVVGQPDMKIFHYLGNVDFILYAEYLVREAHLGRPHEMYPEYSVSRKTGRPLVSTAGAIADLMRCYDSGLIAVEGHVWGWRAGVPRETADYIESHATRIELPEAPGIRAYRWSSEAAEASPGAEEAEASESSPTAEPPPTCDEIRRIRREAGVRPAEDVVR